MNLVNRIPKLKSVKNLENRRFIISTIAIFSIVAILIIFMSDAVQNSIYKERKHALIDTTTASSTTVNTAIEENRKTTEVLTNVVYRDLNKFNSIEEFITDAKNKMLTGKDMFFLVDENGRYFSSDGQNGVLADLSYFASTTEEEANYISTLPHLNQNVTYLIIRERLKKPITVNSQNGQIQIKYCAMMFDLRELSKTISSLFAGSNNTLIYESSTGTMLYKQFSLGLLIEGYNVYPKWSKGNMTFGETPEEMIEKCKNREICVAQIEISGINYYVCSAPIEISDWSLMFVVQEKYINEESGNGFKQIIYLISFIIFMLGAAILLFIMLVFRNKVKLEEEKSQMMINALSEDLESVLFVSYQENKYKDEVIFYRRSEKLIRNVPGMEKEVHYSNLINLICNQFVAESDRKMFFDSTRREIIREKLSKNISYYLTFKSFADGNEEYYQIQFSPVFDKNGINTGFVTGLRSVDEKTREKMIMQEKLEEALETATYASQAKTAFLFNMSHDIRTPINAILGFTNMAIRDIDLKDKVMECLKKIQKSSDILLSLINDILEMSRIESGKVTIADNLGDIMKLFDNIDPVMNDLAAYKKISIDYKFENIQNRYVHIDTVRVQRILINLISNSIKYTNDGGWVRIRCAELPEKKDGYVIYRYTVEDNGIGMSENFQQHLFEAFTREETSVNSGIQGTGLGLSLVKSLTELMGGEVSVISTLGIGSKFTVDIPFKLQTKDEIKLIIEENRENEEEEFNFNGKTVLLVEDNELNMEIASDMLEEKGLTVYTAEDGAEAVDRLRKNGPDAYDFILMDIQMPVMNGYDAAKTIRRLWPDKDIIIIALSANAFEEDKQKSIESGMNDHIAKPIHMKELFKTIKKYL